jgi:N-terminal domain of oxidoreductase
MPQAKRIVLASRPVGEPKPSDFRIEEIPVPAPGPGQVLLRTIWLSLDPYMRGRISDAASYAQPVPIGGVIEAGTVCEVIASNNPAFAKGDIVLARAGWQTHALSDQDRSQACADLDGGRRAGYAWHDRVYGVARHRQATAGRDRRRGGSLRRRGLGCRSDREDQGCTRGRHCRRQG